MPSKILLKWLSFIGGAAVVAFSAILILLPNDTAVGSVLGAGYSLGYDETSPVAHAGSGLPIRLIIPKLTIDAAVEYVGLAPDGAMDVPKGPANVAWFNRGPRPGDTGNSIIAGHFGWKNNTPAVFDTVHTLRMGDKIIVQNDTGETVTFVVRELRTFSEHEDTSEVFVSSDGKAHLNLITCEGAWDKDRKSYSNRLVVFADKEY